MKITVLDTKLLRVFINVCNNIKENKSYVIKHKKGILQELTKY